MNTTLKNKILLKDNSKSTIVFRPVPVCPTEETVEVLKQDWDDMLAMCKRLLRASDQIAQQLYIVQPFLGIVKDHHRVINKLQLFEE